MRDLVEIRHTIAAVDERVTVPEELGDGDELVFHLRIARASRNDVLVKRRESISRRYLTPREAYHIGHLACCSAPENDHLVVKTLTTYSLAAVFRYSDECLSTVETHFLGQGLFVCGLPIARTQDLLRGKLASWTMTSAPANVSL